MCVPNMGCLIKLEIHELHVCADCALLHARSQVVVTTSYAVASTQCQCMQDKEEDGPTTSAAHGEAAQAAAVPAAAKEGSKEGGKGKKRSGEDIIEREKERSKKAKEDATRKAEWFELKQNTSVYVSGLPSDVTEEEVAQVRGCKSLLMLL